MTDAEAELEEEEHKSLDYQRYSAARESANSLSAEQSKFIDQTILTFGGGGLGITLTFLHDFVTIPVAPILLYSGDGLLIISILALLISLVTSQKSISDHIDHLDNAARNDFDSAHTTFMKAPNIDPWAKHTALLNNVAIFCVISGMLLVALFVFRNLAQKENPKLAQDNETKINRPGRVDVTKGLVIHPPAVAPKQVPTQQAPAQQPAPKK